MLGEPLEVPTSRCPRCGGRFLTLARDRQIWKDLAWLAVLSAVGFSFGLVALVLWPTALWLLSSPVWWSIVSTPPATTPSATR